MMRVAILSRRQALLAALALAIAACASDVPEAAPAGEAPDAAAGPTGATFRIAVGVDIDTFDPVMQTTGTVGNMVEYLVEPLMRMDEDGVVHPHLVVDWVVSDDGLTYTFDLKQGVVFHDGTPFDAEAVKFTIERLLDPELASSGRILVESIAEVETISDHTIELRLSEPHPSLIAALAGRPTGILSPTSFEEHGNAYDAYVRPVGTGPYVFGEYRAGEKLTVERFDDYHAELPYYSTVEFLILPEAATRVSRLRAGQADLIILPPVSDLPALEADDRVEVLLAPSNRLIYVAINNNEIEDVRVRRALNHAVDKDAIIESVLFGLADPLDAPVHSSVFGYCPAGRYDYDPDLARDLLADAGADDLTLQMIAPTGRYLQDTEVAQSVVGFLAEVGVEASLQTMDWPAYIAQVTAAAEEHEHELHMLGWATGFPDSLIGMMPFETRHQPPGGPGSAFYSNPEVDALLERAATEIDVDVRADLYCKAGTRIWEEAPWIFLYSQRFPIVYSADVTNVSFRPNDTFSAIYAHPVG